MKKFVTLVLTVALLLTMMPFGNIAEAALASYVPQHLMLDFENGWDASGADVSGGDTTVAWTNQNTLMGSKGSLAFSTTVNFGTIKFPISTIPGNTYEISMWVRFNEMPKTQWVSFVIYKQRADGTGTCWNQITANHTENFAVGKWVKVSATFEDNGKGTINENGMPKQVDCLRDGTISFRVGEGYPANLTDSGTLSYAMDDFFVIPRVQNSLDTTEVLPGGSFDNETVSWNNWDRLGSRWLGYRTTYVSNDGAPNSNGCVEVEVSSTYDALVTKNGISLVFGREYTLSFWAKGVEDYNHKPFPYLSFSSGHDIYNYDAYELYQSAQPELTTAWQKYEYKFRINPITADAVKVPDTVKFGIRMGTNSALQGGAKPHYMIDELSLKQSGTVDFNVTATHFGAIDQSGLKLDFSQPGDILNDCYVYRLMHVAPQGEYCIQSGKTVTTGARSSAVVPSIYVPKNVNIENHELRLDVLGIDDYGNYSQLYSAFVETDKAEDVATLRPDNYLWTDDVETLGATLTYESQTGTRRVKTIAALYSENDELLRVDEDTKTINTDNKDVCRVAVPNDPLATKAKFFAWFEDTQSPITYRCELEKTTDGEFIYLDANSTAQQEDGSYEYPYKTIAGARERLRTVLAQTAENNVYVVFKPGEYTNVDSNGVYTPIDLTSEEWSASKNVIFTSLTSDRAKISGGRHIAGSSFELWQNGIYRAPVPAGTNSRQLYVNGIKATRARSVEDIKGMTNLDIGAKDAAFSNLGIESTDTSFVSYKYPTELELVFIDQWKHQYIMPDAVTLRDGKTHFAFQDGKNLTMWNSMCRTHAPVKDPVYVENALELLDEEGEWYLDTHENYVYYKPRYFENMSKVDVVIPVVDRLIGAKGNIQPLDYSNFVQNMQFLNLDFEYTTWNLPTTNRGFTYTQNSYIDLPDSNPRSKSGTMDAAFELQNAKNVIVDNCDFKHIGSIGLKLIGSARDCQVIGNEFYEISGTAVVVGDHSAGYWVVRNPGEYIEVSGNLVANNYIHKVATDYYGASAVAAGFPVNTTIRNNEIVDGAYSGMHIGWGWGSQSAVATRNFVIEKNYIHDFMNGRVYDGGGIYTLGLTAGTAENPNIIRENYITDIKNKPAYIYPDEGSAYWMITKNVIDNSDYPYGYGDREEDEAYQMRWIHFHASSIRDNVVKDNYSTTAHVYNNGTNIDYEAPQVFPTANWSAEAQKIIKNAGIEPKYQNRFDFDIQSINTQSVEMTAGTTQPIVFRAETSKGKLCDLSDVEVRAKSSDTGVATVSGGNITAVSAGKAWITISLCRREDGKVTYYDEHSFCVIVK